MQAPSSYLGALSPINWSPKCKQNTLIGVVSVIALGVIGFLALASFKRRTLLQRNVKNEQPEDSLQNQSISTKDIWLQISCSPQAILGLTKDSNYALEFWQAPIDDEGDTILHKALWCRGDDEPNSWNQVAGALLEKPFAESLLRTENEERVIPLSYIIDDDPEDDAPALLLSILNQGSCSVGFWLLPIDEDGNTIMHIACKRYEKSDEWKKLARGLAQPPYIHSLKLKTNNAGQVPNISKVKD